MTPHPGRSTVDVAASELAEELRNHARVWLALLPTLRENNRLLRTTMPQRWTLRRLCETYAMGRAQMVALLERHGMIEPGAKPGPAAKDVTIHLDQKLELDEIVREIVKTGGNDDARAKDP